MDRYRILKSNKIGNIGRRICSLVLVFVMCISMLSGSGIRVYAAEGGGTFGFSAGKTEKSEMSADEESGILTAKGNGYDITLS